MAFVDGQRLVRLPGWRMLLIVVVVAVLYAAREVLIPLALAILFSFLLWPAVRRLERIGVPRKAGTVIVIVLSVALVAGIASFAGNQAVSLAGKLPEYRENIVRKLEALRTPPKGSLGKAAQAIKEIEQEVKPGAKEGAPRPERPAPSASAVPTTALQLIGKLGVSLLGLLASVIAVVVLTALMLLQRDDLRDRLVRLVGEAHVHVTTQAMEDAGQRVSRYLLMQLLVNACYGVPLATALHFIGLPNALLFGLLATVLRFVPYLGAAIAASLPILLSFAISEGWETIAWTVGCIATLEFLTAYVVEPWLYGESTGLSPLAIVCAAIFWTWLWGPIGLLLATPLTVCLAVVGRHLPQLGFFHVLLGVEPVLPAPMRLYQRLVAMEYEEALELAEAHSRERGPLALCDELMLPALLIAKRDRLRSSLDERHEAFVFGGLRRIVEESEPGLDPQPPARREETIAIVPARDESDYIAALILARAAENERYGARVLPCERLAAEQLEDLAANEDRGICISAVPPSAAANAAYLCKRLRRRLPNAKILVALWHANTNVEALKRRLREAGADEVVTRLPEALERIRLIVPQAAR
ncbi:MAG: AI-2E family transporter [Betaproteobacteria bacterium]|nr:AI-2E family transporter [Betaproteobacteria bacterium]